MLSNTLAASLVALAFTTVASAAVVPHSKRVDYPQYETEEECHAAGWEVCRRYAVAPGVSLWTGYPGPAEPEAPKFATEAECKAVYDECLGYKRANGTWVWRGIESYLSEDEPIEADEPIEVDPTIPDDNSEEWTWYDTEELCLADGWDYCRSYAVDVGVTKWTGFKGTLETSPRYKTEEECLAAGWDTCYSYKRADRTIVWFGVKDFAEEKRSLAIRDEWTWYNSEAECLADGWDYCRSYAVDVGVTKWTGFTGQPTTTKFYPTEALCLADGHTYCLGFKRADGTYRWFAADDLSEDA